MNCVLSGARADLQDGSGPSEYGAEFFENNLLVVFAGLRKGFSFHHTRPCFVGECSGFKLCLYQSCTFQDKYPQGDGDTRYQRGDCDYARR